MKPESQRIAIAEACGWKNADHPDAMKFKQGWTMPELWCMDPNGVLQFNHNRPDYLNDLKAMHEVEELFYAKSDTLEGAERMRDYSKWLCLIAKYPLHATATQRAEAFLRTIGKWEDAK